jgi:hypothetical protein
MRPSIPISTSAQERLRQLRDVHEMVTYVLLVHTHYMQARSQPSTAPKLQQSDKVIKRPCLRDQLNRKLKDIQLGPFTLVEKIRENI